MQKHNLCFVAGKSGGHLLPAMTIAKQTKEFHPTSQTLLITGTSQLDTQIASNQNSVSHHEQLHLSPFPYRKIWRLPLFCAQFIKAIYTSYRILKKNRVKEVIGMGGIITIPVCLAAWLLRIPITTYELNVEPGKATRFLSYFATKIMLCFAETKQFFPAQKCFLTSYPVRFSQQDILPHATAVQQLAEKTALTTQRKTIFILGGSQGSLFINGLIKKWIEERTNKDDIQIIHQIGAHETNDWEAFYKAHKVPALTFTYTEAIATYYCAADSIICRSGAGTLAEIVFFNRACITIPLETKSTAHQLHNARAYAKEYPHVTVLKQKEASVRFCNVIEEKLA